MENLNDPITKLRNLRIQLQHEVLPQHSVDLLTKKKKKKAIQFGDIVPIVKSQYTEEEDNIIRKNWHSFCEIHKWDPAFVDPFLQMAPNSDYGIKDQNERKKFLQFLANGLPHRSCWSVYNHFQLLFGKSTPKKYVHKTQNHYTPEESQYILDYVQMEESKNGKRKKCFSDLAKMLNRTRHSVWSHYQKLINRKTKMKTETSTVQDHSLQDQTYESYYDNGLEQSMIVDQNHSGDTSNVSDNLNTWDDRSTCYYIRNLMAITMSDHIAELKNMLIPEVVWSKMAENLSTDKNYLKNIWKIKFDMFMDQPIMQKRTKIMNRLLQNLLLTSYNKYVKLKKAIIHRIPTDSEIKVSEERLDEKSLLSANVDKAHKSYSEKTNEKISAKNSITDELDETGNDKNCGNQIAVKGQTGAPTELKYAQAFHELKEDKDVSTCLPSKRIMPRIITEEIIKNKYRIKQSTSKVSHSSDDSTDTARKLRELRDSCTDTYSSDDEEVLNTQRLKKENKDMNSSQRQVHDDRNNLKYDDVNKSDIKEECDPFAGIPESQDLFTSLETVDVDMKELIHKKSDAEGNEMDDDKIDSYQVNEKCAAKSLTYDVGSPKCNIGLEDEDESIDETTVRKLQQLKRMDLYGEISSSDDEEVLSSQPLNEKNKIMNSPRVDYVPNDLKYDDTNENSIRDECDSFIGVPESQDLFISQENIGDKYRLQLNCGESNFSENVVDDEKITDTDQVIDKSVVKILTGTYDVGTPKINTGLVDEDQKMDETTDEEVLSSHRIKEENNAMNSPERQIDNNSNDLQSDDINISDVKGECDPFDGIPESQDLFISLENVDIDMKELIHKKSDVEGNEMDDDKIHSYQVNDKCVAKSLTYDVGSPKCKIGLEDEDESIVETTVRKLQQLKRLDLYGEISSSGDEEVLNSQRLKKKKKVMNSPQRRVDYVPNDIQYDDTNENSIRDECDSFIGIPISQDLFTSPENVDVKDRLQSSCEESDFAGNETNMTEIESHQLTDESVVKCLTESFDANSLKCKIVDVVNKLKSDIDEVGNTKCEIVKVKEDNSADNKINQISRHNEKEMLKKCEEDDKVGIIDGPKTIFNESVQGKKMISTKSELKLGSNSCKIINGNESSVFCVSDEGEKKAQFGIANIRPVKSLVIPGQDVLSKSQYSNAIGEETPVCKGKLQKNTTGVICEFEEKIGNEASFFNGDVFSSTRLDSLTLYTSKNKKDLIGNDVKEYIGEDDVKKLTFSPMKLSSVEGETEYETPNSVQNSKNKKTSPKKLNYEKSINDSNNLHKSRCEFLKKSNLSSNRLEANLTLDNVKVANYIRKLENEIKCSENCRENLNGSLLDLSLYTLNASKLQSKNKITNKGKIGKKLKREKKKNKRCLMNFLKLDERENASKNAATSSTVEHVKKNISSEEKDKVCFVNEMYVTKRRMPKSFNDDVPTKKVRNVRTPTPEEQMPLNGYDKKICKRKNEIKSSKNAIFGPCNNEERTLLRRIDDNLLPNTKAKVLDVNKSSLPDFHNEKKNETIFLKHQKRKMSLKIATNISVKSGVSRQSVRRSKSLKQLYTQEDTTQEIEASISSENE